MIKILIVNDSPLHQKILLALLEQQPGYNIVGVATHGAEAVRMNRQFSPDIILMDIHMPVTNGVEATQQIMKEKPTRILIVTSTFTANMTWIFDAQAFGAMDVTKTPVVQLDASGLLTIETLMNAGAGLIHKIEVLAKVPLRNTAPKPSLLKRSSPAHPSFCHAGYCRQASRHRGFHRGDQM
ncbi:MAG: response regulator [Desulfobacteraceae bacterium]|nr:response regulator [Desulfobacteraceae bacterium]